MFGTSALRRSLVCRFLSLAGLGIGAHVAALARPCLADGVKDAAVDLHGDDERLAAQVAQWIEQLGDPRYAIRARAENRLATLGSAVFEALDAAQTHRDLEVRTRAGHLVQSIRRDWTLESRTPEVRELLKDYDDQPETDRLSRMRQLAKLGDDAGLPALCRLVRFEQSEDLSKQGAILILEQPRASALWPQRSKILLANLRLSQRPGAIWLKTLAGYPSDPTGTLLALERLVETELRLLAKRSTQEQREIVAALLRQQIALLIESRERDRAVAVMRKALEFDSGDPGSLTKLMEWITQQEAWELIEPVLSRFDHVFQNNPQLLYVLADARRLQGNEALANQLASQALSIDPQNATSHIQVGYWLHHRGRAAWAEREYRHVIQLPQRPQTNDLGPFVARLWLTDLLQDQDRIEEAVDALAPAFDLLQNDANIRGMIEGRFSRSPASIRSKYHYLQAMVHKRAGDTAKQRDALNRALQADPTDADVLIAMYRQSNLTPAEHKRIMQAIQYAADQFRLQINNSPEESTAYNQFAWLIANTEGDFDLALRFSQRSLELSPGAAGYIDTLAHCFAAKKNYAEAVRQQAKAIELEPHSQEMRRNYERFKAAEEKQRGGK